MRVLAIDIGSSSVKAGVLQHAGAPRRVARVPFKTTLKDDRAECDAEDILRAVREAIAQLDMRKVDVVAHDAMGPSWLAMDARGKALTKVVTHQDRRSIDEAQAIEKRVGYARHIKIVGARPVPGGISSTTCLWHLKNAKQAMRKASLVGHVSTLLVNRLTGERIIDPSHASFTGLYHTTKLSGWHDDLIDAVGIDRSLLPEVRESNEVVGTVTREAARRFGLQQGTPVLAGCMDGSAAMFATGAEVGQLLNSAGTTDILALAIDKPRPDESILTRALGVGKNWLAVATIPASGGALEWLRETMFSEMKRDAFHAMASKRTPRESAVSFDASLAGSRTRVEPTTGSIAGLKLSTTREEVLDALLTSLARTSAQRLDTFDRLGFPMNPRVVTTGGGDRLAKLLRREWPRRLKFDSIDEAALRGLARLATL